MNNFSKLLFGCVSLISAQDLSLKSSSILKKYKPYLEQGTYENQDWSHFEVLPKSRYFTFKKAFRIFEENHGKIVVELGTSRSFVHGGLVGCNSDDTKYWQPENPTAWDWGAGFFTRMAAESLEHLNVVIHTIDLIPAHMRRCQLMTRNFKKILKYHVCSSVDYLRNYNLSQGKIDLLYLDTGDMTPIEPTAQLHLQEAKIIVERNLIAPNGIILIDDVRNQTPKKFGEKSDLGKAKYSIPYFLSNNFSMIADEYQVILRRK